MTGLSLFLEFFKTGLFAVGGGLATLPFLYRMSDATGWFTKQDIANLIAISESTPGPLGVNMATYAGFQTMGILGGILATLGLVCPSVIIIILISRILDRFRKSTVVQKIFYGLRPASTALIAAAGLGVAKLCFLQTDLFQETHALSDLFQWKSVCLAVVLFFALKKFKKHPVIYLAAAAAAGILFQL
jgi:chromate transporter